jgi:hypothetical protein
MFCLRFAPKNLCSVDAARRMLGPMGDFFVVLGTVAFVLFLLGLIWALDRV